MQYKWRFPSIVLHICCYPYVHCPYDTVYCTLIYYYVPTTHDKWLLGKVLEPFHNDFILYREFKINKYFKCWCVQQYIGTTYQPLIIDSMQFFLTIVH